MGVTRSTRLDARDRAALLRTARTSIEQALGGLSSVAPAPATPALAALGASFVTILRRGELRGCCGSLEARRPLLVDVWSNARASAFDDPRFLPVEPAEWLDSRLEVSVLSALEPLVAAGESDLLAQLEPGTHGLVLASPYGRATFLPKVWEDLPDPREFVTRLKLKAGWPPGYWAAHIEALRYTVEVVAEPVESVLA